LQQSPHPAPGVGNVSHHSQGVVNRGEERREKKKQGTKNEKPFAARTRTKIRLRTSTFILKNSADNLSVLQNLKD
jgi:hypothetical protein